MGNLIGYARVSTHEQNLQMQLESLAGAGCNTKMIFTDKISGAKSNRPGLEEALKVLKPGDTLVVWRLDRLGRSMSHLVGLVKELGERSIGFRSLCDGAIDTTTASGELIFHIFSSLAQFERRLIQERTKAGLAAARARGKRGGRKKLEATNPKIRMAQNMHKNQAMSIKDICSTLQISRSTFYRYLQM